MHFWRPDWIVFRRIFAIGLPIAGIYLIEMGVFSFAVVMMGWIDATSIAAHHIAIQIAAVTFMVPMGIGQAATVRVGQALGRGDPAGVRRAGFAALAIGVAFMSAMSLLIALFPAFLAGLFLDRGMAGSAEVLALAASLLYVAAAFQIVDGMQAICAGALRGLNDTRIPMAAAAVGYWMIGFGVGWTLGFAVGLGRHRHLDRPRARPGGDRNLLLRPLRADDPVRPALARAGAPGLARIFHHSHGLRRVRTFAPPGAGRRA